MIQRSF